MNRKPLLLTIPVFALTGCQDPDTRSSRYSTQTFSVAGGLTVITQITDHRSEKIHFYELKDDMGLVLKETVDLAKCGDQSIPFEAKPESKPTKQDG